MAEHVAEEHVLIVSHTIDIGPGLCPAIGSRPGPESVARPSICISPWAGLGQFRVCAYKAEGP